MIAHLLLGYCWWISSLTWCQEPQEYLQELKREREQLTPLVTSSAGKEFLAAVDTLPKIEPRTVYVSKKERKWLSPADYDKLPADARQAFEPSIQTCQNYYTTFYGTPLAYVRVIELANAHGMHEINKQRVMDFGCGGLGANRLLASCGAEVVGVDVDSFLPALYHAPTDLGAITGLPGRKGRLSLVIGQFPQEPRVVEKVGHDFTLIISKNTLKKGYVTPAEGKPFIPMRIPVRDYLRGFEQALKPGGMLVIYNLSPAQNSAKYLPMADGRSPFTSAEWQQAGFDVVKIDEPDHESARAMGKALGWAKSMGDLDKSLFAQYTIVRKQAKP